MQFISVVYWAQFTGNFRNWTMPVWLFHKYGDKLSTYAKGESEKASSAEIFEAKHEIFSAKM